jgi:hypothetical protein
MLKKISDFTTDENETKKPTLANIVSAISTGDLLQ